MVEQQYKLKLRLLNNDSYSSQRRLYDQRLDRLGLRHLVNEIDPFPWLRNVSGSSISGLYDPNRLVPTFSAISNKNSLSMQGFSSDFNSYVTGVNGDGTAWRPVVDQVSLPSTPFISPSFYFYINTSQFLNSWGLIFTTAPTNFSLTTNGGSDSTYWKWCVPSSSTFPVKMVSLSYSSGVLNRQAYSTSSYGTFSSLTLSTTFSSVSWDFVNKYSCIVNDGDIVWLGLCTLPDNPVFTWVKLFKTSDLSGSLYLTSFFSRFGLGGSNWSQNVQFVRVLFSGNLPW